MTACRFFLLLVLLPALSFGQTIQYDSGYTWRGYTGTVEPVCPSKLCHYFSMNTWDSAYTEFTAWKSVNGNPNSANAFVNFRVIFPPGYNVNDTTKSYPLIVMFHGAGESGRVWNGRYNYAPTDSTYDNNSHHLKHGGNQHRMAVNKPPSNKGSFPGIVVFPQTSYNGVWGDTTTTNLSDNEKLLIGFIEQQLVAKYHVDINRIVAHGLSNGAKSLWAIAQKRPDLFAAILPMSGVPYNPTQAANILVTTPVRLFQGGLDINPTPSAAQQTVNAFISKGGTPEYFLYEDLGHGTWNRAYNEPDFFQWIKARDKRQVHVFGGSTELCNNSIKLGFSANMSSYQWTRDGVDIAGATGRYLDGITLPGKYAVKFQRPGGDWDTSFDVDVVVSTDCEVDRPVLSANLNKTVCSGAISEIVLDDDGQSVDAGTFDILAIQFNGLTPTSGAPVTGTGFYSVEIFDDAYLNKGTVPINVIYTVVPVSTAGYAGDPTNVVLTVNPESTLSPNLSAVRCSDLPSEIILKGSGSGVTTSLFNITEINTNGLVASAGEPAVGTNLGATTIADDAYTNLTPLPVNVVYSIIPVSDAGCLGQQRDVTFSVSPEPALSTGLDATVGSKAASGITLDDDGSSVDAASFDITAIDFGGLSPSGGSPATGSNLPASTISDDAFTNTGSEPVTVLYSVVPKSINGCFGDVATVALTVSPVPVIGGQLNVTRCSGVQSGITLTDNGSGVQAASYDITAINFNGLTASAGNPATGTGFSATVIKDDAYTNTGTTAKSVVYTIVPVSSAGHRGNAATITFTVNPEPTLRPDITATKCSKISSGIVLIDDGVGAEATMFNITSIEFNGLEAKAGTPSTGTGLNANAIANDAFINKTSSTVEVEYTVVPVSSAGCAGTPVPVIFRVNPEPILSTALSASVSSGVASGLALDDSGTGINATTFDITAINANGLAATAGTPTTGSNLDPLVISDDAYINSTELPVNVTYGVVPVSAAGCRGEPGNVTLTIEPAPQEEEEEEEEVEDDEGEDEDEEEEIPAEEEGDEEGTDGNDDSTDGDEDDVENEDDGDDPTDDELDPDDENIPDTTAVTPPVVAGIVPPGDSYAVYPNPTKGRITIQLDPSIYAESYQLLTSTGQLVMSLPIRVENNVIELDLTELPTGLYILRVGGIATRIVKE